MDKKITNLLDAENSHIKKLQEIVRKTIEDENLIIQNLLNPPKEILSQGQKVSDKVAKIWWELGFYYFFFYHFGNLDYIQCYCSKRRRV